MARVRAPAPRSSLAALDVKASDVLDKQSAAVLRPSAITGIAARVPKRAASTRDERGYYDAPVRNGVIVSHNGQPSRRGTKPKLIHLSVKTIANAKALAQAIGCKQHDLFVEAIELYIKTRLAALGAPNDDAISR